MAAEGWLKVQLPGQSSAAMRPGFIFMRRLSDALSLLLRGCGGGLALALAFGNIARADFQVSDTAGGHTVTLEFRRQIPSGWYEVRPSITGTVGTWAIFRRDHGGLADVIAGNSLGRSDTLGSWVGLDGWQTAQISSLAVYVGGEFVLDLTVSYPTEGYRELAFDLENRSENWRTAGVFCDEEPGTMWAAQRVGPLASVTLLFTVYAGDTRHYYAAFVDAGASNANGSVVALVTDPEGNKSVVYAKVVPDTATATTSTTAAAGNRTVLGSSGPFVGAVSPTRVPTPTPAPSGSGAATNEHITAVANSLAGTFTDGLRAVESAIREQEQGTPGGTAVDLTTVETVLDRMDTRAAVQETRLQAALTANPTVAAMDAAGTTASAEIRGVLGTTPAGKGYSLAPGGAPNLTVAMPAAFGGQTFDLNPFQAGRLGPLCSWFRSAVNWAVIIALGAWAWAQMGEWMRGFSTIRQAQGNAVVGGTGAQATALVAAGLITAAVVSGTTAMVGWAFDGISFPSFVAATTTNPLATIPTGVFWMLDQVFPVATIVTAAVARLTFSKYSATIFAGVGALVRFIVP